MFNVRAGGSDLNTGNAYTFRSKFLFPLRRKKYVAKLSSSTRDEQAFGLETENETRAVSVLVSIFETKASKSQSHFLRHKEQSLSLII